MTSTTPRVIVVTGLGLLALLLATPPADARPQYSAREGMYCVSCHVDPAGGGLRRANGFAYALGRHEWEAEPKFEEWKVDPEITKGVRLGSDLRYVGMDYNPSEHYDLPEGTTPPETPATYANYAMQGSIYFAFQPVEQILLYYNLDLGAGNLKQRDWYGMVQNIGSFHGYVKAGQIRSPYGIRFDDHTSFVRGRVGGPPGEIGMMELDPRSSYPGVEIGATPRGGFVHVAYQDEGGVQAPNFVKVKEKAVTAKAGLVRGHLLIGASARLNGRGDGAEDSKSCRYGPFVQFGQDRFSLAAEYAYGCDQFDATSPDDTFNGIHLGGEYYLNRAWTFRAETGYMDRHKSEGAPNRIVARRYSIGAELTPLPFLRLANEIRYVSNSTPDRNLATQDELWNIIYGVFSF